MSYESLIQSVMSFLDVYCMTDVMVLNDIIDEAAGGRHQRKSSERGTYISAS